MFIYLLSLYEQATKPPPKNNPSTRNENTLRNRQVPSEISFVASERAETSSQDSTASSDSFYSSESTISNHFYIPHKYNFRKPSIPSEISFVPSDEATACSQDFTGFSQWPEAKQRAALLQFYQSMKASEEANRRMDKKLEEFTKQLETRERTIDPLRRSGPTRPPERPMKQWTLKRDKSGSPYAVFEYY